VAVARVFRYLAGTKDLKLVLGGTHSEISGYSDADWAGQKWDRKSTSGSAGILCGGAITWASRVQRSVATSSTESEYMAMSGTAKTSQWVAQVLRDIGYPKYIGTKAIYIDIRGDNQGALALIKNPHLHERSKHIDICYHHIRDLAERQRIDVSYIPTDEMIADILTKNLGHTKHNYFVEKLGMVPCLSGSVRNR